MSIDIFFFLLSLTCINQNMLLQNDYLTLQIRISHAVLQSFFFLLALTTISYMETGPSAISEVKNTCKYLFYPMTFLAHSLYMRFTDAEMLIRMLQLGCFIPKLKISF